MMDPQDFFVLEHAESKKQHKRRRCKHARRQLDEHDGREHKHIDCNVKKPNVDNTKRIGSQRAPEKLPQQPKREKPRFNLLGPHSPRTEQRIAEIAQQTRAILDDALSTMSLEEYAAQYDAYMQSCDLTQ